MKSVRHQSGGDPFNERAYTMTQAASAVGKSLVTFRRWITDGIIPEPEYEDTSHKYVQYLHWEIEALIGPIADHFDKFDYLHTKHEDQIHAIWRALDMARLERGRDHVREKET